MTSSRLFAASLVLGGLLRLLALPLPGTGDVMILKIWSYGAVTSGVGRLYGVEGESPERREIEYQGRRKRVNYPPLSLYILAAAGRAHHFFDPTYSDGPGLTSWIKLPSLLADVGLTALLFAAVKGLAGAVRARAAALAYWLNPAVLLNGAVLGYTDPVMAWPAIGAIGAAVGGRPILTGVLLAVAGLIKPQAILLAPAVALALAQNTRGQGRAFTLATLAGLATTALTVAPVVIAGGGTPLAQAMASLGAHDMLSGDAANLWWLVTFVKRSLFPEGSADFASNLFAPVRILRVSTVVGWGYPNPRPFATAAVLVAAAWALWRARRTRGLTATCAVAALIVHAYFVLAVGVHENHQFLVLPLLAVTAAVMPRYRRLLVASSLIVALNLDLLYGFGLGVGGALPRGITGIDATVPLALANVLALAWHARVFASASSERQPA